MSGRNEAARVFVILGSVVLFASAALHCFAGYSKIFQALTHVEFESMACKQPSESFFSRSGGTGS